MTVNDTLYMQRCLDLAALATGYTSPNPLVGAILVHQDRIIGEGYHHRAGEPHAEVNCFVSVRPEDEKWIAQSTLYVSLEPCSHYGKTPPCAELVLQKRVPRVVVAMQDPFPEVAGRGIALLRSRGVEVEVGVLEEKARRLNRFFLTAVEKNRPWVTLKWAQSRDGFIDRVREDATQCPEVFSSPFRQRYVHYLRHSHDAILVGRRTVELDNPSLTNRFWWGTSPQPIVLDSEGVLCHQAYKINQNSTSKPWFIVSPSAFRSQPLPENCIAIERNEHFIASLLETLASRKIQSLLVEGGTQTLQAFLDSGLYDAVEREVSPRLLHEGVAAPIYSGDARSSLLG